MTGGGTTAEKKLKTAQMSNVPAEEFIIRIYKFEYWCFLNINLSGIQRDQIDRCWNKSTSSTHQQIYFKCIKGDHLAWA